MKRARARFVLGASALLILAGCAEVPSFLFGATDVPVRTEPATLGVFLFDDTLEPNDGELQVGNTAPALSYISPGGLGRAVTVAGTFEVTYESDTEDAPHREGRVLEIPLGTDRLPGTVAVWVRVIHERTETGGDLASVRIVKGSGYAESGQEEYSGRSGYSLSLRSGWTDSSEPGERRVTAEIAGGYIYLEAVAPVEDREELGYHLAVTYDAGGRVTFYVNGERRGTARSLWNRARYREDLHLLLETGYSTYESPSGDPANPDADYQELEVLEPSVAFDNLHVYRHALSAGEVQRNFEDELGELRDE